MLEKQLQSKILKHLKATPDTWVAKVIQANKNGVPDLLVCFHGHFIGLEVKVASGRPTPLQEAQLDAIRDAGGTAVVVCSIDDVRTVMEACCEI